MNPLLEKVTINSTHSFALKEEILPFIEIGWHIHPEYELTLFTESTGKMFIGDYTTNFGPGDLLLIGPNLPHYMRNDAIYYEGRPALRIRAIVVHFSIDFLGRNFFDAPELGIIKKLLEKSSRGIHLNISLEHSISKKMETLLKFAGYERLRCLLDILYEFAKMPNQHILSSIGFKNSFDENDIDRVNKVYTYLLEHFSEEIKLSEMASLINMNPSAFCKFFKKRTGKTFSQALNEIRIGHACKLFIKNGFSVSQVCYECGYNSLSYFNRKFKAITDYSPLAYKRRFFHS